MRGTARLVATSIFRRFTRPFYRARVEKYHRGSLGAGARLGNVAPPRGDREIKKADA
jgi:hypothetical protein